MKDEPTEPASCLKYKLAVPISVSPEAVKEIACS
jgi:hypothetical protein